MLKTLPMAVGLFMLCSAPAVAEQLVSAPPAVHRPMRSVLSQERAHVRKEGKHKKLEHAGKKHHSKKYHKTHSIESR
jgi:hypothetical protein